MKILYLGDDRGTSLHRINALRRLGGDVHIVDPRACFAKSRFAEHWIWHVGGLGMASVAERYVMRQIGDGRFDVCVVNQGELVGTGLLGALRQRVGAILNYINDNPFASRDKRRWSIALGAMPQFDLIAVPREPTMAEGMRRGLKMYRYFFTADEVVHRPKPFSAEDNKKYGSEVAFVGSWFPERGQFIVKLLEAGVAVRIFGINWHKAPEYERFKDYIALSHFLSDDEYIPAVQYSKIALGFVSSANEDLHTTRSLEIPAIGTLLCAQRTSEHQALYQEDEEAVFWDDMDECAAKCRALLAAPDRLASIAAAGAERQAASENWNEILMSRLIESALSNAASRRVAVASA